MAQASSKRFVLSKITKEMKNGNSVEMLKIQQIKKDGSEGFFQNYHYNSIPELHAVLERFMIQNGIDFLNEK